MTVKLSNNVRSSLRTTLEIGDTTLNLPVGHGVRFPALGAGEYFYVTVEDAAGDSEILQATARVTDTLTVVRGAEGTTPREFVAGSVLEMRVTAASVLDAAQDAADAVDLADLGVTASAVELNILDGVTASTAELNILDGVTADASEINVLDGILASTAELNILDGVTASTAELNILDGVTASTTELNVLAGITASTAELNILDGVTATAAELNVLDGVTATAAELNVLDGVTTFGGGLLGYADEAAFKVGVNLEIDVDVQAYDAQLSSLVRQNLQDADYTLVATDSGKHIYRSTADSTARAWTIPANASVPFPVGTIITFDNDGTAGVVTIAITSDTLSLVGLGRLTGSRTLAVGGQATAVKVNTTRWRISGTGLT